MAISFSTTSYRFLFFFALLYLELVAYHPQEITIAGRDHTRPCIEELLNRGMYNTSIEYNECMIFIGELIPYRIFVYIGHFVCLV